ncbi:MAG: hypothetical protein HFG29_10055 [Eubacterium sp.]|nr:hypothetical protein [Eubacterium sp.]
MKEMYNVANDENKLSKSELEDLLKEVERDRQPVKKVSNQKKKSNIRIDMIIAAIVAVVLVIGVGAAIIYFVKSTPTKEEKAVAENPLQDEKYPEISDVVKNYLNAFLIEDNQKRAETIAQYVGNLYDINSVKQRTYISGYSGIECYTKEGPYENTYVVYAYYQMGIKNIETTVPCIDRLYVVRDTKTGNVYIQNDSGEEIQKYMDKVTKDADVQQLLKDVEKEFEDAKASDTRLKEFFDKLKVTEKKEETTTQQTQVSQTQSVTTVPHNTTVNSDKK